VRRDLLIGVLLVALGGAGALWQIEGPANARGSTRPMLVCPLGGHGLEPAPLPRLEATRAEGTAGR